MSDVPDHFCPACGTPLKAFQRYPWHLCKDCRNRAVDGAGRALKFSNEGPSGGFMVRYARADKSTGDEAWVPCRAVIALVSGRPVYVTEARFGGVVAEPLTDRRLADLDRVQDLRRGDKVVSPVPSPGAAGRGRPYPKG